MGRIKLSHLLFFLFIFLILLFFHTRGLIIHDEGYILNSAERIITGQTIYKDFHFAYTPLSVYFVGFSFLLFGKSIFASRMLMILLSFYSSILIFKIIKRATKRDIYALLTSLLYVAWGPTHINFAWPIMFVIPFTLLLCYLIIDYIDTRREITPFLVGILSFVIFLLKQNFGIILIPVIVAFIFIKPFRKTHILNLIYGFVWGIIFFTLYLLITNSFSSFLNDFYYYSIKRVVIQNILTTPFIYSYSDFIKKIGRALIYILPAVISFAAFVLLIYRKRFYLLFLPVMTFLFYIVGIRPTTDYVHLVPLLSLTGIPLAIFINQLPLIWVKLLGYALFVSLILIGFQTALFKGYYRWDIPLINNNLFLETPRTNIFTNNIFKKDFLAIQNLIDQNSEKGDYIFIDSYAPLLYFALDRKNPTGYDYPGFIDNNSYQKYAIYSLIVKKVPIIMTLNTNSTTLLEKYIHNNYRKLGKAGQFYIYKKLDNGYKAR
jgi:hypothetical protein